MNQMLAVSITQQLHSVINQLSDEKVQELLNFALFLLQQSQIMTIAESNDEEPEMMDIDYQEYILVLDGIIEVPTGVEAKPFFDGLMDTVLAHVEQHNGTAGVEMVYKTHKGT